MQTVWITGASKGIGAALALHFAQQGWRVIASARNADELTSVIDQHENCLALVADVCERDKPDQWLADWCVSSGIKQLDAVVINAGTAEYIDVPDIDVDKFRRVFDLNVMGAMQTVRWAMPLMQAGSRFVFVSSMATLLPFTRAQAYASSKAALDYIASSLQTDLLEQGIGITVIKPGFIKTPLTDKNDFSMPFIITPEQAAPRMFKAITKGKRLHHFPKRMLGLLTVLRCLPKGMQHRLLADKRGK